MWSVKRSAGDTGLGLRRKQGWSHLGVVHWDGITARRLGKTLPEKH